MKVYKGVLFTGSSDNTIKTWDCKTLNILQTLEGHTGAITDICMGSDMIYTSSDDKSIRCWVLVSFDLENLQKIRNFFDF